MHKGPGAGVYLERSMEASVAGMEKTEKRKGDEDKWAVWGGRGWGGGSGGGGRVMEGLMGHEYFGFYVSVV